MGAASRARAGSLALVMVCAVAAATVLAAVAPVLM